MTHIEAPEFNETEFESAINIFYYKFLQRYPLFDFNIPSRRKEKDSGVDFANRMGIPFFLQYKVSDLYLPSTTSPLKHDRTAKNYVDNLGFFSFDLHRDIASNHEQHNLLFKLTPYNFYVAPKFYKKEVYYDFLRKTLSGAISQANPYVYFLNKKRVSFYNRKGFLFLDDCFYLKPHKKVTDKSPHCYTYNMVNESLFHSEPEEVNDSIEFISDILEDCIFNFNERKQNFEKITNDLIEKLKESFSEHSSNWKEIFNTLYLDEFIQFKQTDKFKPESTISECLNILSLSNKLVFLRRWLKQNWNISMNILEYNNY